ncbi:methylenetetrahydrofolate reductase (NADPH) [Desulfitispora alkaliphila]|uniref:methylenetetrahydrofolate reductase [NAD(P)H] n=1 Tax=Desulfitispora alkaliphila TaxID=622674 RepID=UPI003D1F038E
MHIGDIFEQKKTVISFEVFPPKKDGDIDTIYKTIDELAHLRPDFISVTYGAGGSGSKSTIDIASLIKRKYEIEALAHLTCITSTEEEIKSTLEKLKQNNLYNVLALRGDYPKNYNQRGQARYNYAVDLIEEIKAKGSFCVGAAAYPEGHIECSDVQRDLEYLKQKVNVGADFLITQLFFDNQLFYRFKEKLDRAGIDCKLSAGIMPILSKQQVEKMIYMCGASLPAKVIKLLVKYENNPESLKKWGIEYAAEQAEELVSNGVDGVHIYTMNQPQIARAIVGKLKNLSQAI